MLRYLKRNFVKEIEMDYLFSDFVKERAKE